MKKAVFLMIAAFAITFLVGCEAEQLMQSYGSQTYQVDLVWGEKGEGNGQFRSPMAITTDSAGNVFVCDMGNKRIEVFDSGGNYLDDFGGFNAPDPEAPDGLQRPMGIAIDAGGHIWVSDNDPGNLPVTQAERSNRILEFDNSGNLINSFGYYGDFGSPPGRFNSPRGLAFDSNGILYVCDSYNNRIQTYDPITQVWAAHGSQGYELGFYTHPRDVAIDTNNNIIIADSEAYRIQKLDSNWNPLASYGIVGQAGSGDDMFNEPSAVDTDDNDFVYVADSFNYRVMKFDQGLTYICKFGNVEGTGAQTTVGTLSLFYGLTVHSDGKVYVSDFNAQRISRFVQVQ